MALRAAVGIDYTYIGALQLALNDYNAVEGRTQYHETLVKEDDSTTCVTIMYSTVEPVEPIVPKEEFEFIGSRGIDPQDPNWRELMDAARASGGTAVDHIDAADIVPDGAHTITADTIVSVQLDVKRAQEGT